MPSLKRSSGTRLAASAAVGVLLAALALLTASALTLAQGDRAQLSLLPSMDAYVASGRPDQSWPSAQTLWLGHDQSAGYGNQRVLLKFALAGIPAGSQIQAATLRLYVSGTTPGDAPMAVQARRMSNAWSEAVTWNQYAGLWVDNNPSATTQVNAASGWREWNVTAIVQEWRADPQGGADLSFLLTGYEAGGQHERVFWSRSCSDAGCGVPPGQRPALVVQFATPTATPTRTPSPTPTRTPPPTATPTAGLRTLVLRNSPSSELLPGEEVRYTIDFRNGPQPLTEFRITNPLPAGVDYVIGSASAGGTLAGGVMTWELGALAGGASGDVGYSVRRPPEPATSTPTATPLTGSTATATSTATQTSTPTATPTSPPGLAISVSNQPSQGQAMVGVQYWYDVTVTNQSAGQPLDRVELANRYNPDPVRQCVVAVAASHAGCALNAGQERWNCTIVGAVAPGASLTVRFTYLAADACSGAQNANTATAVGWLGSASTQPGAAAASVPIVANGPIGAQGEGQVVQRSPAAAILNSGATGAWQYNSQPGTIRSNVVTNPGNALWLPLVQRR